jgi:prepilin-type processing-associated H-X9-DG protein
MHNKDGISLICVMPFSMIQALGPGALMILAGKSEIVLRLITVSRGETILKNDGFGNAVFVDGHVEALRPQIITETAAMKFTNN